LVHAGVAQWQRN